MSRFEGHTVLVTGASLGVGRAVAQQFHREGANVALVARRRAPLDEVADALGDRVLVATADVADLSAMERVLSEVVARFGGLNGVINNAGLHHRGPVAERSAEELALMVDVNLRAPIVLTRLALPLLQAQAHAYVVNVASLAGKIPLEDAATYSSTKSGCAPSRSRSPRSSADRA